MTVAIRGKPIMGTVHDYYARRGLTLTDANDASFTGHGGIRVSWQENGETVWRDLTPLTHMELFDQVNAIEKEIADRKLGAKGVAQRDIIKAHEIHDLLIAHTREFSFGSTAAEILKWAARLTKEQALDLALHLNTQALKPNEHG